MSGKTLIVALSILAVAATAADAATKKHKKDANPPAAQVVEPVAPVNTRTSASPFECWTDEGYGRRLPCSYGGK